jgi:hypothetical protein
VTVLACSSTTTGTGTGGGGGGLNGLFGGANGGGTSGGTSGGATTVPTSCTAASGDDSCIACLKQHCCSVTLACTGDAECKAIVDCSATCSSQTCANGCVSSHPNGQSLLQAVVSCEKQSCVTACEGTVSSSGSSGASGSSGTSGTGTSCVNASPSYCSTVTGKPNAKDCPAGPPAVGCEISPSAGSFGSVYCCP